MMGNANSAGTSRSNAPDSVQIPCSDSASVRRSAQPTQAELLRALAELTDEVERFRKIDACIREALQWFNFRNPDHPHNQPLMHKELGKLGEFYPDLRDKR